MQFFEFLRTHGLQTAAGTVTIGLIAGIWALVKQFHDYSLKKREQGYANLITGQGEAIRAFTHAFTIISLGVTEIFILLEQKINPTDDFVEKKFRLPFAEFRSAYYTLFFYLFEEEMRNFALIYDSYDRNALMISECRQMLSTPDEFDAGAFKNLVRNIQGSLPDSNNRIIEAGKEFQTRFFRKK